MKNIAILASGSGSNAENIYNYFKYSNKVKVKLFLTNNPQSYVKTRAKNLGIQCVDFNREQFNDTQGVLKILLDNNIDYVVLAGFLWLLPAFLVEAYKDRIINIHPSLLPKFGGKGMFGDNVHKAVVASGEKKSGITIHRVDAFYDSGMIIKQFEVDVLETDTFEDVADKVHALEYKYFPEVIAKELEKL